MERKEAAAETLAAIADEHDYAAVQSILARGGSAPVLLRKLMGVFEAYRGSRKYGWSRPWNKRGLRTFLAYEFVPVTEVCYFNLAARWADLAKAPRSELLASLSQSKEARGFVFLHERKECDGSFEGLTISFGRISAHGRRHRDRYDVIVERRLDATENEGEAVVVRVFDDPYSPRSGGESAYVDAARSGVVLPSAHVDVVSLLARTLTLVRSDALDSSRHWTHWTQDLIDSFGPRRYVDASVWFALSAFARDRAARPRPDLETPGTAEVSRRPA